MRWRADSDTICGLADQIGVGLVVTLGALLADTPHTRPVPVSSTASDDELIERLHLTRSNYEGPTGIVGVLHDARTREPALGQPLVATPHYISATPNPRAAVALLERLEELAGTPGPSGELVRAASEYAVRVARRGGGRSRAWCVLEQLESAADEEDPPTGEDLAKDFERYLREQGGGDGRSDERRRDRPELRPRCHRPLARGAGRRRLLGRVVRPLPSALYRCWRMRWRRSRG